MLRRRVFGAAAAWLVVLASSAEGFAAIVDLLSRGRPLSALREVNIDAITAWWYNGLRIDGVHRTMFYNPQHSLSGLLGREHVRQEHDGLDVAPPPALVGKEDRPTASGWRGRIGLSRERENGRRRALRRKRVIAGRGAAGHLDVNERVALLQVVLGDETARDLREERRLDREPQRRQAVAHPGEVLGEAVGTPGAVPHHLVDRVGKEEAAVFRGDPGLLARQESAVQVDDHAPGF